MVVLKRGENVVLSTPLFVHLFYLKYLKDIQRNINKEMDNDYPVMDFVIGGAAGAGAVLITNPLDVVRTRMQLQGELRKRGEHAVHYRGVLHALQTIAKNDGLAALYRGISSAVLFQLFGNSIRPASLDATRAWLDTQVASCLHLKLAVDYRHWKMALFSHLVTHGNEDQLRAILDDMLGPSHGVSTPKNWHSTILDIKKHELLEEMLALLVKQLRWQRLYSEYNDQLTDLQQTDKVTLMNGH